MEQVKKGYKQTEIGVIPEDWTTAIANNLCIKIQDGTHFSPILGGSDYLYVTSKNIGWGSLDISNADKISEEEHQKIYTRCDVKKGDVLLTKDGANTGNATINWLSEEFSLLSSVAFLRFKPNYDARFYLQYILSNDGQSQMMRLMSGNAITRLTLSKIKNLTFPVPSTLKEQQAIAEALSEVDEQIASLDALIAKKRDIKQGAMQNLLTGRERLSGFSGEWEMINISENATLKARIGWQGLTTAEYLDSGNYYLVTGTDFVDGRIDWNNCHFVDKYRYDQDKNIQLRLGDVLITKDGTIGKVAYIDTLPADTTLNSGVFVIRPTNQKIHSLFLYYIFTSIIFKTFLAKLTAGSTINHLYQKDFVGFNFLTPKKEEQEQIARFLYNLDEEIAGIEAKRDKTITVKQGMMQELLTGKTRLI